MQQKDIRRWSNPTLAKKKAIRYGIHPDDFKISTRAEKKYMVFDGNKWVHFGSMGNYDNTKKPNDYARRDAYLARARNIKGNWKSNKYSANNLAIHILW